MGVTRGYLLAMIRTLSWFNLNNHCNLFIMQVSLLTNRYHQNKRGRLLHVYETHWYFLATYN